MIQGSRREESDGVDQMSALAFVSSNAGSERWEARMISQESDLITILLDRLRKTEGRAMDPEAETLIRETTTGRPDAPYSLVQTVLIQDLSLHNAQNRITDLETQLTETKRASSAPPNFLGGPSFLGAVFGRGEPSDSVRTSNVPPGGPGTGPPIAATPQPGYAPEQSSAARSAPGRMMDGGGFLPLCGDYCVPALPAAHCSSTASSRCSDITTLPALPVTRL